MEADVESKTSEREWPLISIGVSTYNRKDYLILSLESLLAQTYPNCEIIVVDDGSTDGTGELADTYAAKHANLRVIHQINAGSSAARNTGINEAQGAYLGFVDSDDTVSPGMYEAMLEAAERLQVPMVQTGRDERAEDGSALPSVVKTPDREGFILSEEMLFLLLLHEGDASFCTKLTARWLFEARGAAVRDAEGDHPKESVRRRDLRESGADDRRKASEDLAILRFPVGELNEDFRLLIRMLDRLEKLAVLPRTDYHVRYRLGSNSRKKTGQEDYFPPVFTDIVRNSDAALDLVSRKHPGILPVARRFALVQRLDYLLHIPVSQMTPDHTFYMETAQYLKKNRREILLNPYLSKKERRNLWLMSFAPRTLRALHARLKKKA